MGNFFRRSVVLISVKLLFLIYFSQAQEKTKSHDKFQISAPEKVWALFHPFAACKIYKAALTAREEVKNILRDSILDNRNNGGMMDAFRHSYWMALSAQKVRWKKALRFGEVHERGNYRMFKKYQFEEGELPDSVSRVMDIYNNTIGALAGRYNKKASKDSLKQIIINKILQGEMILVAIDCKGNYVDCNKQPIDMKNFEHQWSIPKCLLNSNENCSGEK